MFCIKEFRVRSLIFPYILLDIILVKNSCSNTVLELEASNLNFPSLRNSRVDKIQGHLEGSFSSLVSAAVCPEASLSSGRLTFLCGRFAPLSVYLCISPCQETLKTHYRLWEGQNRLAVWKIYKQLYLTMNPRGIHIKDLKNFYLLQERPSSVSCFSF